MKGWMKAMVKMRVFVGEYIVTHLVPTVKKGAIADDI